ncbi:conjugative transfer ATPase [Serratia microhaemolytica]|uniref:conjugative transfer ATPase n=1 Tax=Serratia microhaemolytica TaxID=2675110 RepID=UPI000FDDE161|nr:conjugative transfer ATPase [Serratia microhaemolytica]
MFSLFKPKSKKSKNLSEVAVEEEVDSPLAIQGREPLTRPGKMTHQEEAKVYQANPSIIDYLPWVEYLDEEKCLLLDDGVSVGAVYEVIPVATEGRTQAHLEQIRDTVENALQDSLDEFDEHPWVVQFYCQDEEDVDNYLMHLRDYVKPHAQGSTFTEAWLTEMERHIRGISRPAGLFEDELVTGQPWRGQQRRIRMVIYRWLGKSTISNGLSPVAQLNQTGERIESALGSAGIRCIRQDGQRVHRWLLRLFNPAPEWIDKRTLYREARHVDHRDTPAGQIPVNNDFTETLWFTPPVSDPEQGVWWIDNQPHCAVAVEKLRDAPEPGAITGERERGKKINALMDMFPEGSLLCITIVVQPQDRLEAQFNALAKNAVGENTESARVRQDVKTVKEYLGNRHKLYRAAITVLLRAQDMGSLKRKRLELSTVLLNAGLEIMRPEFDVAPLNSWLRALPMCFNPENDKKNWYTRLTWVQHLAGLLPITGRETGTGHPGFSFFNRGGDVLTFDPLNKYDRTQNAHLLLFGPSGAGKSATLCASLSQVMAIHRPRLFIAEAGNSFGLLADYFEELGLTVNKISIKPGSGVSLPPFADAHRLVAAGLSVEDVLESEEQDEENEDERDVLGEMEISARLMITGGDLQEEADLKRADRAMIREALLAAANKTYQEGRQMLPADLQQALYAIATDNNAARNAQRKAKAAEMAESLGMFTQQGSFEAELFNREGALWAEADVTLVDLGHFARQGYEAQMALTMVSMTNMINNIAERDQYLGRDIIFAVDEAHIVTVNPLLSPYMTKVVKMWRKLGAWLWLATQNLKDFPDVAEKMLNMAEWWVCLTMPPEEVKEVSRFRALTPEQQAVLLSARKQSGCYTEGVVLAKRIEALFRAVPPSLYLALGMTEKEEKAARRALMQQYQCSELDAAKRIAHQLDIKRGLLDSNAPQPT